MAWKFPFLPGEKLLYPITSAYREWEGQKPPSLFYPRGRFLEFKIRQDIPALKVASGTAGLKKISPWA